MELDNLFETYRKKNTGSLWKMNIHDVYGVHTLEINTHDFTVEILKLVENRYENLDEKFQGNWLVLVMWVN